MGIWGSMGAHGGAAPAEVLSKLRASAPTIPMRKIFSNWIFSSPSLNRRTRMGCVCLIGMCVFKVDDLEIEMFGCIFILISIQKCYLFYTNVL